MNAKVWCSVVVIAVSVLNVFGCGRREPYAALPLYPPTALPVSSKKIGSVDGVALLVAWHTSKEFNAEHRELVRQRDEARAAGNEAEAKRLESIGAKRQDEAHERLAGRAPLDPVLERLRPYAEPYAKEKGLDAIVVKGTKLESGQEVVDVTTDFLSRIPKD